ncbi:hypothetical protein PBAL39_22540 [Pedobacter sp. BAL39]|uniref:DUF6266 family protein n=1 Tax=Pedobacter sp. BAL39 TaxID=391596 RepID=UPI00015597A7|nr:DUF6266 family protein [Pedobacter sp. BAL39]EDM38899.1 hypothetical protein PBAL39_22540 [Pedobacter sp. BAL39]
MPNSKRNPKGKRSKKVGRTVSYLLNGKMVTRSVGIRTTPFTPNELAIQFLVKLVQKFMNSIEGFLHVGYELEARLQHQNQQNVSFSYIRKNAIAGIYPDVGIDYAKVLVAMGALGPPMDPVVTIVNNELLFTWKYDPTDPAQQWADQVMLLAYFPEVNKSVYITAGERREKERALLELPRYLKFSIIETCIAFVASDRRKISNSVYTGRLTLTKSL